MISNVKKKFLILILFLLLIFIPGCIPDSGGILDGIIFPKVSVSGKSQIELLESFLATAKVTPEGKYADEFIWESSNPNVLDVSDEGYVTGISTGTASVIAKCTENDSVYGRLYVKVIKKSIQYTEDAPTSINLLGSNEAYVDTISYFKYETTPFNSSQDVVFASSNEEIATVDSKGIVKFNTVGTVTITVASSKDNAITDSITVNVTENSRNNNIEEATINVIKETKDSIIGIANYQYNNNDQLVSSSIGSGFVYFVRGVLADNTYTYDLSKEDITNYEYLVITNRHVIENSDAVKVYLHTIDEEIDAELIHYDDKVDMAIVKFRYDEYIKPLKFSNSDTLVHGETVIAIGNPEGFEFSSSATRGIVSYPERFISDDTDGDGVNDWDAVYIQHDASINPGNSGGPLLNMYGEVIGINTLKFASAEVDNMGFSIPSNTIVELLPYLENGKVPQRAKIGITVIAVLDLLQTDYKNADYKYIIPEGLKTGLYITDVTNGSPAFGILQKDDILLEFNGVVLRKSIQLRAELGEIIVGSNQIIKVKVLRNGKELVFDLTF